MIIAIDGPAGSGKSTIANILASRFGYNKLDSGAMYRTVAFICADDGIDLNDEDAVVRRADALDIAFDTTGPRARVLADGRDVTDDIRTPATDRIVSAVSAYPGVRSALLPCQRAFANGRDVVAEGRDIGTVVFPDADLKVFLTADPRERARRRVLQRHPEVAPDATTMERELTQTLADLERRDEIDAHRAVAPLRAADDAVSIDSTAHTIDEIVNRIVELANERRAQ